MKGITPIIAVVLLVLIMVALVGFVMVFFTGSLDVITEAGGEGVEHQAVQLGKNFKIDGASGNNIYLRNTGTVDIAPEEVSVFVNEAMVSFIMDEIAKDRQGTIVLDSVTLVEGDAVKVTLGLIEQEYSIKTTKKCQDAGECVEKMCRTADCIDGYCVWSLIVNQEHAGKCDAAGNGCTSSSCWCNENGDCVEQPPVDVGDGLDGNLLVSSNMVVNNYAYLTGGIYSATAETVEITVDDASDFAAEDEIMIIQSRGNIEAEGIYVGTYEFKTIENVDGNTITLNYLDNSYASDLNYYKAQIVSVPNYNDATILDGATLSAGDWDGNKGGIIVFRASGSVSVEYNAVITATGRGYMGGSLKSSGGAGLQGESDWYPKDYSASNNRNINIGGGGGSAALYEGCGGGGGSHASAGDKGEDYPSSDPNFNCHGGDGGAILPDQNYLSESAVFGGGGGSGGKDGYHGGSSGKGGDGGGIILIFANSISISGNIYASGETGGDSTYGRQGSGGGGAGGSILLVANEVNLGTNKVQALGGIGGTYGYDGGNGGQGRIEIHSDDITGTTNPAAVEVPLS